MDESEAPNTADETNRRVLHKTVLQRLFLAQLGILGCASAFVLLLLFFTGVLGSFAFAFFAGCLGGSIALVRRLPRADQATIGFLASGWVPTLMPLLYGGLMAVVTYMLFMSGILTGDGGNGLFTSNLFPNFTRPAAEDGDALLNMRTVMTLRPSSVADAGKLMVWCFVSGFSERFVVGILGTLEERGGPSKGKRAT